MCASATMYLILLLAITLLISLCGAGGIKPVCGPGLWISNISPIIAGKEGSIKFAINAANIPSCRSSLSFNNTRLHNFYFINRTEFVLHFLNVKSSDAGNYTLEVSNNNSCITYNFGVAVSVPTFWDAFLTLYIWPVASGVVVLLVIILVICLARCKTKRLEKKIDELISITQAQVKQMKYMEKLGDVEQTDLDQNFTAMTPTSEQQENGERHHIDVQSTPSYPPPSPPVNTRRQRKSPALRPFSKHFYDECQPVKDRPPFPLPSESTKVPENPLYDAVAPDENPSRFKKFGRSVKTMVTSNSRKFGHHIAQKYGNISAINIPAFKVASPLEHDPNNLSNYDQSEFTPSTSQN